MNYLQDFIITLAPYLTATIAFMLVTQVTFYAIKYSIVKWTVDHLGGTNVANERASRFMNSATALRNILAVIWLTFGVAMSLASQGNLPKNVVFDKEASVQELLKTPSETHGEIVDRIRPSKETDDQRQKTFDDKMNWRNTQ